MGFKQQYKNNAYKKYLNAFSLYNSQISQLNTQWQNKLKYDKYNQMYNEIDTTLQRDIQNLKSKYEQDCSSIDTQINSLIKQR